MSCVLTDCGRGAVLQCEGPTSTANGTNLSTECPAQTDPSQHTWPFLLSVLKNPCHRSTAPYLLFPCLTQFPYIAFSLLTVCCLPRAMYGSVSLYGLVSPRISACLLFSSALGFSACLSLCTLVPDSPVHLCLWATSGPVTVMKGGCLPC